MQSLEVVSRSPEVSWYRVRGDHESAVQRWVVSTPETVAVCNQSNLIGVEFSRAMRQGLTAAVRVAPFRPLLESVRSSELCIVNFLRGGLNFGLRSVLHDALGSNHHCTCFMSSQRYREGGRWMVKEDMYRKLRIPEGAVLLIGDVVATGVTAENGLEVVERYLVENKVSPRAVVFFTIGCHKVEKILESVHDRFSSIFSGYEATHAVYIEGKFRLVDSSTPVIIGIPGTDLIKRHALLSPELVFSQFEDMVYPLERCVIYDAGSRAFDVREYLEDVIDYWENLRRLARRGHTLAESLAERWPRENLGREAQLKSWAIRWPGLNDEVLVEMWSRQEAAFGPDIIAKAGTGEALEEVCLRQLELLRARWQEVA